MNNSDGPSLQKAYDHLVRLHQQLDQRRRRQSLRALKAHNTLVEALQTRSEQRLSEITRINSELRAGRIHPADVLERVRTLDTETLVDVTRYEVSRVGLKQYDIELPSCGWPWSRPTL